MVDATTIPVDDIAASSFPVKVVNRKGKPIAKKTFAVAVDDRNESILDTDDEGRMKIGPPKSTVRFTLKTPLEEAEESGEGTAGSRTPSE